MYLTCSKHFGTISPYDKFGSSYKPIEVLKPWELGIGNWECLKKVLGPIQRPYDINITNYRYK
jgi:hypothetical protein